MLAFTGGACIIECNFFQAKLCVHVHVMNLYARIIMCKGVCSGDYGNLLL